MAEAVVDGGSSHCSGPSGVRLYCEDRLGWAVVKFMSEREKNGYYKSLASHPAAKADTGARRSPWPI